MKHKIKIYYVIDFYEGPKAGTERQIYELLRSLDKNIYEPVLFVLRPTDFVIKNMDFPCDIVLLDIPKIFSLNAMIKLLRFSFRLKKEKVHIVHLYFNDASIIVPIFGKLGGSHVVGSRRDMGFWYTNTNLLLLKFSNTFVDMIIANSISVKNNVIKYEKFPENKIVVIYNGHDQEAYNNTPKYDLFLSDVDKDTKIIGMVANFNPIKRHGDILRAYFEIQKKHKNTMLILIGNGYGKNEIINTIHDLNLDNKVKIICNVDNPIPFIKRFDICVLCSESEGLSNAIIEYLCCEKPVICTNVGGNSELIENGYNGYLVDVGNVEEMADRLDFLLKNNTIRDTISENCKKSVENKFLISNMIDSYNGVYNKLVNISRN